MDRIDENGTKSEDDYASQYLNSLDDKIDNKNYDNVDFTSYNGKQQLDLAYKFFNNNQFENLYKLLKTVQNLDIFSLMDKKNYTLVHRIVLNQSIEHLKFALEYVRKYLYSNQYPGTEIETQIIEWLNFKTDGGFTALHYASYRGDIRIIQYLIQNGADFQAKNSKGLNAIHIAAQGDQPISIRYFQKIGLNTDDLDFKQGNPLHWACFLGNENAIHYLTSFTDIDINQPDQQGLSPLHLAVISGNARAVKRLLLKGADRTIKDKQDKTAGFLANEQGYENIANMIDTEDGFEEYCNLRQPFRPIKKSVKQVVIFYFLFLFIQALFIAFILPCLDSEFIEFGTWAVISSLTLVFQVSVWFANPGEVSGINNKETLTNSFKAKRLNEFSCVSSAEGTFNKNSMKQNSYNKQTSAPNNDQYQSVDSIIDLKQPHSVKLLEESKSQADEIKIRLEEPLLGLEGDKIQKDELILLFKAFPIDQICMDCQIIKPQRSKHCEVCKKCIRVYDHHCPWVNNCVGVNNYKYFISFIVALWLSKLALLTLTCIHITTEYDQANDIFFNWYQNVSNDETMHIIFIVKYVAAAVIISITLPFFVMLTVLCFVQINNLFLNQTTYERFNSSKKNDGLGDSSSLISSRDPNQNLDSEMFSANSPMKDQSNNKKNDMKKKKSKSGNSILRRFSFHNAFQMCCLNKKNHLLDFNKNICMRQISIQDKDPETSFY